MEIVDQIVSLSTIIGQFWRDKNVATPKGLTDKRFAEIAEKVPSFRDGGIGLYLGRIHVDIRKGRARWKK